MYQLNNYVYNHIYNYNIVDIVLLLISNAYKMVINVLDSGKSLQGKIRRSVISIY